MNKKYTYIVVDDKADMAQFFGHLLADFPEYEMKESFTNPLLALEYLNENHCDLMFLDVEMPELTGFELLDELENPPLTIMVTAYASKYSEKAHEYYDIGIIDFLPKNFDPPRVRKSLDRFERHLQAKPILLPQRKNNMDYIAISENHRDIVKLSPYDIVYLSHEKNYTYIHDITGGRYCKYISLKQMIYLMPNNSCIQVNRHQAVMLNQIVNYSGIMIEVRQSAEGALMQIHISPKFRAEIVELLGGL